ncbi:MAG TPA: ATP-binding cassette domain-containing protein [Acidimicrobiales bacterium]|nr:ATP-binding cassette domain-containing protein [Acidimicrobiales bacterium]
MTTFLALTIVGIVDGCIYALTATGLVVTYITSGIFNFAHGAIGMVAAFTYWDLTVRYHWPIPLALAFIMLVLAPALGAVIDRVLMRKLHGAAVEVTLVVTVGLLLFLLGLGQTRWDPGAPRVLPKLFGNHHVKLFGVFVSYHEVTVVVVAVGVAVLLRLFLFRTRPGVALRAVVDAPETAALHGAAPARVGQMGWAIGAELAALAGILLAPLVTLDSLTLTLLVINGYAAAIVGRLRSLPLTFAGGVVLGLFESYAIGYIPGSILSQLRPTLPIIFLYVALLILPQNRLRVGRPVSMRSARTPELRRAAVLAGLFVVGAWIVANQLSVTNLFTFGRGMVLAIIMLSVVVLTGYGGQVSLAQLTFVGFGAFAMGKVAGGGSVLGVLAAVALAGAVGALAALPALRLQGLYLGLITFAFAEAMTAVFFHNNSVFGQGGALRVGRPHLLGMSFAGERSFVMLIAVVLGAAVVGTIALRRSWFGRQLAAMSDSQAACATLGLDLTRTKLAVFALSAGLAGLAGVLFGGLTGSVGADDFQVFNSLAVLLLLAIWGMDSVVAALIAGMTYALFPTLQHHFTHIRNLSYLATGFGALGLASNPRGAIQRITDEIERFRRPRRGARPPAVAATVPATPDGSPVTGGDAVLVPALSARTGDTNGSARGARPEGAPAPAVELIGVRAAYGTIEVVHGVDLLVPEASVFALIGPNGAGKTTLLRLISGTLEPSEGCVHVAGVHINGTAPEARARLGVCTIPEGRGIFANLTVAENLRMMTYRDGIDGRDVEARAYGRFPRLGERRSQLAGTLSGGEQQMLAMARAVATEPSLLLLDEISMGLAPMIVSELYELVGQLADEGIAILLVEQFVKTAMSVADYVGVMTQGRIERVGEGVDVADMVSAAYMGALA